MDFASARLGESANKSGTGCRGWWITQKALIRQVGSLLGIAILRSRNKPLVDITIKITHALCDITFNKEIRNAAEKSERYSSMG